MAEGCQVQVPTRLHYSHVKNVTAVLNLKRVSLPSAKELKRPSTRLHGSTDEVVNDKYILSASYFPNAKKKKTHSIHNTSQIQNNMEERLKIFQIPASFPDPTAALEKADAFKDLVETLRLKPEELPSWIEDKKTLDAKCAEIEKCDEQRESSNRLRKPHRCLGSLLITN